MHTSAPQNVRQAVEFEETLGDVKQAVSPLRRAEAT
jgi:hypothetical protein